MLRIATILSVATLLLAAVVVPAPTRAQQISPPSASSILVLNQDRLLQQTQFGQRIAREIEQASALLAAENRVIEQQLTTEELSLTEQRPTMSPEAFRVLADDFDARVDGIRNAQVAKTRDLQAQSDAAQQRFFDETVPILLQLVEDRGASILLDSRTVLLSAGSVDITDAAIAAIDDAMGDGGDAPLISLPGLTPE